MVFVTGVGGTTGGLAAELLEVDIMAVTQLLDRICLLDPWGTIVGTAAELLEVGLMAETPLLLKTCLGAGSVLAAESW